MTASHDLRVADLTLGYSERDIITNLDLQIAPGRFQSSSALMPAASPPC